jgi:hypothetical protein
MATSQSSLFNPTRYETVYGVGLFDDLHNYLPEILYDSELFLAPMMTFLQRRVQTLFESEYVRNRTQYRMFQQSQRRRDSGVFIPARSIHTPAPFQEPIYSTTATTIPTPVTIASVTETITPPRQVRTSVLQTPPRIQRRNPIRTQTHTAFLDPTNLGTGLSAILLSALTGTDEPTFQQSLAQFMNFDPVPVAPSEEQLSTATFLTSIEPPNDVVCSICQDHNSEENTSGEWRYIRFCNHAFHRTCIDHWFQEHVQCPVCRFDIRQHPMEAES